jgi:hypothetical protein
MILLLIYFVPVLLAYYLFFIFFYLFISFDSSVGDSLCVTCLMFLSAPNCWVCSYCRNWVLPYLHHMLRRVVSE